MKVPGLAGPIEVRIVEDCKNGDIPVLGKAQTLDRSIEVRAGMSKSTEDTTLWHEWMHFLMFDTGCQDIPCKTQERMCDIVATGMMSLGFSLPRKRK